MKEVKYGLSRPGISSELLALVECVNAYRRFRFHSSKQGRKENRILSMIRG